MEDLSITFEKDHTEGRIIVMCRFNASVEKTWDAFTNSTILEKWFAPKPYSAVTKTMEFKNGGKWLYYMLSPAGEKFWGISVFSDIHTNKSFKASDGFCDENGIINPDLPQMNWEYQFQEENGITAVSVIIIPTNKEQMQQVLKMGFEEGYKIALKQLEQLFNSDKN